MRFRTRGSRSGVAAIAAASAALAWLLSPAVEPYTLGIHDAFHQLAGVRRDSSRVALVQVDEPTLIALADDPLAFWQPHFAHAMRTLEAAGAKVVGLDMVYSTSAETWLSHLNLTDDNVSRTYDAPFREQLAAPNPPKVLAGYLMRNDKGAIESLLPPPEHYFLLQRQLGDVGLSNLLSDGDNVVRRFETHFKEGDREWNSFAQGVAQYAAIGPLPALAGANIGYAGPPGSIEHISMLRLLLPNAQALPDVRALAGRAVIIGAHESAGLQDVHLTPYARRFAFRAGALMSGAEVQANIVNTLLTGSAPRFLPPFASVVSVVLVAFLASALVLSTTPAKGALTAVGLAAALLVLGFGLFLRDWLVPIGTWLLSVADSYLLAALWRLRREERLRIRLRDLFGRYVSDDVVDLLVSGDSPELGGDERVVSVLFCDIRNFTSLSERLTAAQVVELLNVHFGEMCGPILGHQGNVDKFIGDAVMAVFGSPNRQTDHATRAFRAALDMRAASARVQEWMNVRFPDRDLPAFAIGIGIHSGRALVGSIGTAKRREFTAIGDTVNTASRIEGATKDVGATILVSDAAASAAGSGFILGAPVLISVKGKAQPITVMELKAEEARS